MQHISTHTLQRFLLCITVATFSYGSCHIQSLKLIKVIKVINNVKIQFQPLFSKNTAYAFKLYSTTSSRDIVESKCNV